ncbi:MAG: hypothetical protein Q7T81_14390 [Pseudolabrys sp.]|nr:hypothetical protein [Pseudolabrys sp.]
MSDLATEDDIARARTDPAFRQQLLAHSLERLLAALNTMRKNGDADPDSARQIREGVDLAVKLADRLHEKDRGGGSKVA